MSAGSEDDLNNESGIIIGNDDSQITDSDAFSFDIESLFTDYPEISLPSDKPENAGPIQSMLYSAPVGNTSYIPLEAGYIRNVTSLSHSEVADIASQSPEFTVTRSEEIQVLIVHTHTTESYEMQTSGYYDKDTNSRTTDENLNVTLVGEEIAKQLRAAGIGVIVDKTLHDYPSYTGAYDRSAVTVKKYLKEYPTIKVVLDVHRDAIEYDDGTRVKPYTEIEGLPTAQIMIISGCDNGDMDMPNYEENLKFASLYQSTMESMYPTLTRPILFDYRKYNQDLSTGSILLEMGSHANTLEEAVNAGYFAGKALAVALLGEQ